MNISFEEIGHLSVTLPAGNCKVGGVCIVDNSGSAVSCTAQTAFCGVVEAVRGKKAAVQIHGFVTLPYTGSIPSGGYCGLSANGTGGVQVDSSAKQYLVVLVDLTRKTVTFEL